MLMDVFMMENTPSSIIPKCSAPSGLRYLLVGRLG